MLALASTLFERLNAGAIRYCHWKSNWILAETLEGKTDLDLLVHREDAPAFRELLHELGFRPAVEHAGPPFPSVQHHHALDDTSGELVHVHSYHRVVSGGSLAKNYHLPLEEMLLGDVREEGVVKVPSRGAELVVFVLRMSLKHTTLPEVLLVRRDWENVRREAAWLVTEDARAEAAALLPIWLPSFDSELFSTALDALARPAPLMQRVLVGRRVRSQLRPYARHGRARAWLTETRSFAEKALRRTRGSKRKLSPGGGGAVVAFVGPEATGKSTLIAETERWLGGHFTVRRVHAGKPPSTLLTALPNLLLPAFRSLLPGQRSTTVSAERARKTEGGGTSGAFPLLFGIRSVLLAHDRRTLLTRAYAEAANGAIVLCDRYPSVERGALDGAQLGPVSAPGFRRTLARAEAHYYSQIPRPDLVLYLHAPLEVALERNRSRGKAEPESYVLSRHARSSNLQFGQAPVRRVETDRPLDEVTAEIRRILWEAL